MCSEHPALIALAEEVATSRTQTIYLVRHGRTVLNAEGRLRGLADPPLDEVGVAEARATALALAGTGATRVHSSPLQRARRTAGLIAYELKASALTDSSFVDRDYGPQTGRLRAEVEAEFGTVDAAPGVEPLSAVTARALPALDAVLDEGLPNAVVVVTHDAVITAVLAALDPARTPAVPTASWSVLRRDRGEWSVEAVDRLPAVN